MRYLITGITGSLGKALLKQILKSRGSTVTGISRNEHLQWKLKHELDDKRVTFVTADICNPDTYSKYLNGIDILIHTAALKHVESANMDEYVRINQEGTKKLFALAPDVRKILISTDKACEPSSVYGYTKALAESIALNHGQRVVRLGNFTVSHGNLLELFDMKDPQCYCAGMTRFFETTEKIANFILERTVGAEWKGICVPKMKTAVIGDIFEAYNKPIDDLGWFRHGEKMHETLVSDTDRPVWDMGDWYFIGERAKSYQEGKMKKGFTYKSNKNKQMWMLEGIREWKQ